MEPSNYRGIALLSCLGKPFTSIISSRLEEFVESDDLVCENQSGFRKGYSTLDHSFLLKGLIDLFIVSKKENVFVAFIDYEKAFVTMQKSLHLWKSWYQ